MTERTCSIPNCDRPSVARGWCSPHWQRWRRYGDPLASAPRRAFDPWTRIDTAQGDDQCWPWASSHDRDGYAVTKIGGRQWRVCRWVLTQKLGRDLDPDEVTRHTCDNPGCCNPAHLIVGAAKDNTADMIERGRAITGDQHWARRQPDRLNGG